MKKFLTDSKRILTGVLASLLVLTSVPEATIISMAAPAEDEIIFEEVQDVVENDSAVTSDIEVTDLGEVVEEVDPVEPDNSKNDLELQLNLAAKYTEGSTGFIQYALANTGDNPTPIVFGTGTNTHTLAPSGGDKSKYTAAASDTIGYRLIDSENPNGYTFFLKIDEGKAFAEKPIASVKYYDVHSTAYANASSVQETSLTDPSDTTYKVEKVAGSDTLVKVTLTKDLLDVVNAGRFYSDYDATDSTKKGYYIPAQISITVAACAGSLTRDLDMTALTLSADLQGNDMHAATILPADRRATYISTSGDTDKGVFINKLDGTQASGAYVFGKTLTADMISVTYTPIDERASLKEVTTVHPDDTATSITGKKYAYFGSNQLQLCYTWINDFVTKKADITVAIDGSLTDENKKNITVVADSETVSVFKADGTTALDGTTYDITATDLVFVVNTKASTRTVKEIVVSEDTDKTSWKLSSADLTSAGVGTNAYKYTLAGLAGKKVDDDLTITVTTQEDVSTAGTTNATILNKAGEALTHADTKTALEFSVRLDNGYGLSKVEYKIGTATTWTELALTTDNKYSLAADLINSKVNIKATTVAATADEKVSVSAITDSNITGIAKGVTNVNTFAATGTSKTAVFAGFYGDRTHFDSWHNTTAGVSTSFASEGGTYTDVLSIAAKTGAGDWASTGHWGMRLYFVKTGETFYDCSDESITGGTSGIKTLCWRVGPNIPEGKFPGGEVIVQTYTFPDWPAGGMSDATPEWLASNVANMTFHGYPVVIDFGDIIPGTTNDDRVVARIAENAAMTGEEFYFTATAAANYSPIATYKTSQDGQYVPATLVSVSGQDYTYKTDRLPGSELYLNVTGEQTVKIITPANTAVILKDKNGKQIKNNDLVATADWLYFTVEAAAGNKGTIKVDKVEYSKDGGSTKIKIDPVGGTYAISPTDLKAAASGSNPVGIYVTSTETITTGYTVKFALAGDNADNPALTGAVGSQTLSLLYGAPTGADALTAEFKTSARVPVAITSSTPGSEDIATATKGGEGMYPASYKSGASTTAGEDIIKLSTSSSGTTVTPDKLGEDTITSTLKIISNGNTQVYSGDLKVTVQNAYTDLKLVAEGKMTDATAPAIIARTNVTSVNDGSVAAFSVYGTNTRTGKEEAIPNLTSGVKAITFSFDPDNKDQAAAMQTYRMGTALNTAWGSMTTSQAGSTGLTAYVRATKADPTKITVKATLTLDGKTDPVVLTKDLNIVSEAAYAPFSTVKIENGATKVKTWTTATLASPTSHDEIKAQDLDAMTLELAEGGQTEATIDYSIYKQLIASAGSAPATQAALDKASSEYEKADGITYAATYKDLDGKDYINLSTSGSVITIKALKKTASAKTAVISAYKDGALIATSEVAVTVVNNKAKQTVRLLLDDTGTYEVYNTTGSRAVQQSLTGSYYTGRTNSVVETTDYVSDSTVLNDAADKIGTNIKSIRGIEFTEETEGGAFVLPTQADFDATKVGENRVLLGWAEASNPDTVGSVAAVSWNKNKYYYPGEEISVSATASDNVFIAIWADQYSFNSNEYVTSAGDTYGFGGVIYNGNLSTEDSDGEVSSYGLFAATAGSGVTKYSDDSGQSNVSNTTGQIAGGGSIPVVLWMTERIPYSKDMKDAALADSAKTFGNQTIKDIFRKGADIKLTVGGANKEVLTSTGSVEGGIITVPANSVPASTITIKAETTIGTTKFETLELPIEIVADPKLTLSFDESIATNVKTAYVDQTGVTLTATLKQDGTTLTNGNTTNFTGYSFNWSVTPEDGAIEITPAVNAETLSAVTDKNVVGITPVSQGTSTVSLTVKDAMGIEKTATWSLTVAENGIAFAITDLNSGAAVTGAIDDPLYALAGTGSASSTSVNYSIAATPAVNWGAVTADGTIVTAGAITPKISITVNSTADELSDEGYINVGYSATIGGKALEFSKKLYVSTYYELTLHKDTNIDLYKGETKIVDSSNAAANAKVRITMKDQVNVGTASSPSYKYNLDLSEYKAVYTDTDKPLTHTGWKKGAAAASVGDTPDVSNKVVQLVSGDTDGTDALKSGSYDMVATFANSAITKVVVAQDTVSISNEAAGPNLNATVEKANSKAFSLTVEPFNTKDTLVLIPDKATIYSSDLDVANAGKLGFKPGTGAAGTISLTSGKAELTLGTSETSATTHTGAVYINTTDKVRTDNFIVSAVNAGTGTIPRAGKVVFDVQSKASGESLRKITVFINGYDAEDNVYYEAGEVVKNDSRSVAGATWFFDDKGAHVTGNKIITKADGKKIAVVGGALASAGEVTIDGKTYYVGSEGFLFTTGIHEISGVDRLFREDGSLVFYNDSDVKEGKITVNGTDYIIEKDTNKAEEDHKHTWGEPVWTWSPSAGIPTAAVATFTCSVGKETKDVEAVITSEKSGEYTDYTAKVTFEEKEYTDVITLDADNNRVAKHTHDWKTDNKWTWDPATGVPTSASLTFTCTVGEKPETKTVTGSAVAGTPNKKGAIKYTVEITGLDGKPYSTSKTIDASGQEISGDYNFEDDAEEDGTFTASFEGDENEFVYTGSAIKPIVVVNNGEKTLVNGVDYTLSYKNNINAGTGATVTVKGKGLYTSSLDLNFTITKASIAEAAIGNLAYKTGTASDKIKPTANYKGKALKLGTDFTIKSMGDLDSATNTQTLTIAGAGNNFDSESEQEVTITYAAKPAKISATINVAKSYDYTGEEVLSMDDLRDLVTVSGLAEGANFYVTAGDLVNAGTCKIAVTADGFTGTKTASFKINPAKNATFTVTNADDLTTTGTKFKVAGATPFVAVNAKISDTIDYDLVLGKDYKVTYSKNKEAGTGTAKITFQGNYKGAKAITQTFKINKANLEDGIVSAADFVKGKNAASKAYMAAPDKKLFVTIDGMQIKKSEYAVTYKQGDTVLTGKNDITFDSGEATITVEIAPSAKAKSVEAGTTPLTGEYKVYETAKGTDVSKGKVTVVSGGKTAKIGYTGTAITFAQDDTERQGDLSLKIGKTVVDAKAIEEHFDITYINNVNKGKATVILTAKDGDESYTGSATGTFTIGAHVFNKAKDIKD